MLERVLCSAVVDPTDPPQLHPWKVTVTGVAPHDKQRVYHLTADDDTKAAQEGIRLFVAEMERLGQ